MFKFTLLTPEKKILMEQPVDFVNVPADKGEIQVLSGHAPFISVLGTGILKWKQQGDSATKYAVVSSGCCHVFPGGLHVLADQVDFFEDIDTKDCEEYIERAQKRLATEFLDNAHWDSVQREVARMRADLELIKMKNGSH